MKTLTRNRVLFPIVGCAVVAAMTGCNSNSIRTQHESVLASPAGELETLSRRHADIRTNNAQYRSEMHRMMIDDIRRALYIDRSSRLSRMPIASY